MKKFCFVFENFCFKLFFLVRFWLMDSLLLFVVRRFFSSVFLFWLNIRYTMMMMMGSWDAFCLFVCVFFVCLCLVHTQAGFFSICCLVYAYLMYFVVWLSNIIWWLRQTFFCWPLCKHNEYTMWKTELWMEQTNQILFLYVCV